MNRTDCIYIVCLLSLCLSLFLSFSSKKRPWFRERARWEGRYMGRNSKGRMERGGNDVVIFNNNDQTQHIWVTFKWCLCVLLEEPLDGSVSRKLEMEISYWTECNLHRETSTRWQKNKTHSYPVHTKELKRSLSRATLTSSNTMGSSKTMALTCIKDCIYYAK